MLVYLAGLLVPLAKIIPGKAHGHAALIMLIASVYKFANSHVNLTIFVHDEDFLELVAAIAARFVDNLSGNILAKDNTFVFILIRNKLLQSDLTILKAAHKPRKIVNSKPMNHRFHVWPRETAQARETPAVIGDNDRLSGEFKCSSCFVSDDEFGVFALDFVDIEHGLLDFNAVFRELFLTPAKFLYVSSRDKYFSHNGL